MNTTATQTLAAEPTTIRAAVRPETGFSALQQKQLTDAEMSFVGGGLGVMILD